MIQRLIEYDISSREAIDKYSSCDEMYAQWKKLGLYDKLEEYIGDTKSMVSLQESVDRQLEAVRIKMLTTNEKKVPRKEFSLVYFLKSVGYTVCGIRSEMDAVRFVNKRKEPCPYYESAEYPVEYDEMYILLKVTVSVKNKNGELNSFPLYCTYEFSDSDLSKILQIHNNNRGPNEKKGKWAFDDIIFRVYLKKDKDGEGTFNVQTHRKLPTGNFVEWSYYESVLEKYSFWTPTIQAVKYFDWDEKECKQLPRWTDLSKEFQVLSFIEMDRLNTITRNYIGNLEWFEAEKADKLGADWIAYLNDDMRKYETMELLDPDFDAADFIRQTDALHPFW